MIVDHVNPTTYSNDMLDELARAVFVSALKNAQQQIDGGVPNAERLHALAAIADAAACGFKPDEDDGDAY